MKKGGLMTKLRDLPVFETLPKRSELEEFVMCAVSGWDRDTALRHPLIFVEVYGMTLDGRYVCKDIQGAVITRKVAIPKDEVDDCV